MSLVFMILEEEEASVTDSVTFGLLAMDRDVGREASGSSRRVVL